MPSDLSTSELVPLSTLRVHPRNPNVGNVEVVLESLRENGQYQPILVSRETRMVLAGNTTFKAAKKLGWSSINVNWFDGGERECLVEMIEDNKSSDGSVIDDRAVFLLAQSLPSLAGTGYTAEDLQVPDLDLSVMEDMQTNAEPSEPVEPKVDDPNGPVAMRIGQVRGQLAGPEWERWRKTLPKRNSSAMQQILEVLGLIVPEAPSPERHATDPTERVKISDLTVYPDNPNQGDVGLLMHLLETHGQTRPVVANRRNNRILVRNHVAMAAKQLGWKEIAVAWVDVDSDTERRIVLVDNRSRQLARYNMEDLGSVLSEIGLEFLDGTGFTLSDLDDILAGNAVKLQGYTTAETTLQIGGLRAKVKTELVADLNLTSGQELVELAAMLGINPSQVVG